ncbi:response regulator transcription factor [Xanthobacter autotrophicus]|uniref:response regulator transcription factor n=1 Tax=Xanthobacter autotrophicus TaxID=280 RepID=UPI00372A019A
MNLLLVDDDVTASRLLTRGLKTAGYSVDWTESGREGLRKARSGPYGAVILDRTLPDMDGLDLCRRLRSEERGPPILVLSAQDSVAHKVDALDAGGDDVLAKPFALDELLARLRALMRRTPAPSDTSATRLCVGDLVLDGDAHQVLVAGVPAPLTVREFHLLEFFMKSPNKPLNRAAILTGVWGLDAEVTENSVDVYVGYLRRKIDELSGSARIVTMRGVGFKLAAG